MVYPPGCVAEDLALQSKPSLRSEPSGSKTGKSLGAPPSAGLRGIKYRVGGAFMPNLERFLEKVDEKT